MEGLMWSFTGANEKCGQKSWHEKLLRIKVGQGNYCLTPDREGGGYAEYWSRD